MFKFIRITILLGILAWAAFYTKIQHLQSRSWSEPLAVTIYPINGDNSNSVNEYINNLESQDFSAIDAFIKQESEGYNLTSKQQPTITNLGAKLDKLPPPAPMPGSGSTAEIILWSLKLRYWVWQNTPDNQSNLRRVRIFVLYHEPEKGRHLLHSVGIDNGLVAIVNAFGAEQYTAQNNVVITHELLHTVGATDKYDANSEPLFPHGYAEPELEPLHPQNLAEIMAGRIPISEGKSQMPLSLNQCVIGEQTAAEINWH
jgi:hypothetical protein